MRKVFDPIRQAWVAATPEEIVRQTWIQRMIEELQFPKELIAVEKELRTLPHITHDSVQSRRIDILCFMKKNYELKPLLLMECKESLLTEEALAQAIAYNHYVQAPYVAVASGSIIRLCYQFKDRYHEMERLPSYLELIEVHRG